MKIFKLSVFTFSFLTLLTMMSCSKSNVRVMPEASGSNTVMVRNVEKYNAEQDAYKAARAYCEERGKEAVFLSDDVGYTGSMDESKRVTIRNASGTATIVAGVLRATEARDAAVVFEGGAAVGRSITADKDYEAVVRFNCKSN